MYVFLSAYLFDVTVILLKVTLSKQNAKFEIFFHPSSTFISINRNIYVKNLYTCIKMYQEIHVIPFFMIYTFNSYTCLLYNYWKYIQGCIPCRNGRSLYHIENLSSSDYYSYGRNLFQKSHQHTLQDEILTLRVYLCNTNVSLAFSLRRTFVLKAYDTSIGIEFRT